MVSEVEGFKGVPAEATRKSSNAATDCQNDVTKLGLKTVADEGCFFTMSINVSSYVKGPVRSLTNHEGSC